MYRKAENHRYLGERQSHRQKNSNETGFKLTECVHVDWIRLARYRAQWRYRKEERLLTS
jgi:hypothetical protein